MWDVRVRVCDSQGQPLAGHGVRAALRLRLGGAEAASALPAEVRGQTDAQGEVLLTLPAPSGLADPVRFLVTSPQGEPLADVAQGKATLAATNALTITIGEPAPIRLGVVVTAEGSGAALPGVEILVLARGVGAEAPTVVLMGHTDALGRLSGPYPSGAFSEVHALLRLDPDRVVPLSLVDGMLPAEISLRAPEAVRTPPASPALPAPGDTLPPGDPPANAASDEDAGASSSRGGRRSRQVSIPPANPSRRVLVLLGAVIFVGAFLRLFHLGDAGLTADELSSWRRTDYNTIAKVVEKGVVPAVAPPGHALVLYLTQKLGDSEAALRAPSAIAGIAALFFLFLLGRRLWTDREGLVAAALMAVGWGPIRYSQDAGAYSFAALFSIGSVWLWIDVLRQVDRRGKVDPARATAYILTATLLGYLSYFGLLLVVLQGAGALGYSLWRGHRRPAAPWILGVYGAIAALYLPWARHLWEDLTQSSTWVGEPDAPAPAALLGYLGFLFHGGIVLAAPVAAGLLGVGITYALKNRNGGRPLFSFRSGWGVPACWLGVPFALLWFLNLFGTPVLSNTNLLVCAPAVYLLLARAVTALPVPPVAITAVGVIGVGLSCLQLVIGGYYTAPNRQQIREAVQYLIDATEDAEDAVIIVSGKAAYFNYYFEQLGADHDADLAATTEDDLEKLDRYVQKHEPETIWRIRTGDAGPVEEFLEASYTEVQTQAFLQVAVSQYKQGAAEPEEGEDGDTRGEAAEENASEQEDSGA